MRDGPPPKHAFRIAAVYAIFGTAWILLSDRVANALVSDQSALDHVQTLKGWFFIAVTALLLHLLIRRQLSAANHEATARLQAEREQNLARREADEANRRLTLAARSASLGYWEYDLSTQEIVCDSTLFKLYHIEPDRQPPTLADWFNILHPEDGGRIASALAETIAGRGEFHVQFRILHPGGAVRHLEGHATVERAPTGEALRVLGVNWDITERILAEQHYRLLADNVADVLWVLDLDTLAFTYMSPSVEKLRGFTAAEVLKQRLDECLTPASYALSEELLRTRLPAFLAGDPSAITGINEFEQYCKDGSTVWTEAVTAIRRRDQGGFELIGITRDITERRAAEHELATSARKLRHAETIAGIGHWSIRLGSDSVEGSENAARIYGLPPNQRWSFDAVKTIPLPQYRPMLDEAIRALVAGEKPYDVTFRIRRPTDAALVWIHSRAEYDAASETIFGTIQDITEQEKTFAALREATNRLNQAEAIAGVGNWTMDYETGLAHGSAGAIRMYGVDTDTLSLDQVRALVLPHHHRTLAEAHAALAREGRPFDIVYEIRRPADGRIVMIRSVARYDPETRTSFGVMQDITEREATLAALRANEAKFRLLVGNAPVVLFQVGTDGRLRMSEGGGLGQLGLRPGQAVGESVFDLYREYPAITAAVRRALTGQSIHDNVQVGKTWFEIYYSPMVDDAGKTTDVIGLAIDITERKRAESLLRLESAALAAAAPAVVITDARGIIEWANRSFTSLSGYTVAEAVGRDLGRLVQTGKQSQDFYRRLWATILAGETWHGEIVNRTKAGTLVPEEQTITPVRDEHGRIAHFIAIKQDISERRRLQEQVLRSQRLDSIGRLAGGIAHDLNNILAPILMAPAVLREAVADPSAHEVLDAIETSANRGAAIIRQLLTFSRGSGGERQPVQLRHIVRDMLAITRETFPKNIETRTDLPTEPWLVQGDATQLHQVLMNLCVNARDAMPEGGTLTIALENVELDADAVAGHDDCAPGPHVLLGIFDTGTGIPPEHHDKVFDPFFTTKEVGKGTGLGLATVLGIVRSHRGFVALHSEPGAGTQMRVYLPAAKTCAVPPAQAEGPLPPRGRDELILVVDDEENVRRVTRRLLEHHGYRVLAAADGAEALARYQQNRDSIRLVVTDLLMPVMDGPTLIRAIHEISPEQAIVAVSGHTGPAGDEALRVGTDVVALLGKPYTRRTLLKAVDQALRA